MKPLNSKHQFFISLFATRFSERLIYSFFFWLLSNLCVQGTSFQAQLHLQCITQEFWRNGRVPKHGGMGVKLSCFSQSFLSSLHCHFFAMLVCLSSYQCKSWDLLCFLNPIHDLLWWSLLSCIPKRKIVCTYVCITRKHHMNCILIIIVAIVGRRNILGSTCMFNGLDQVIVHGNVQESLPEFVQFTLTTAYMTTCFRFAQLIISLISCAGHLLCRRHSNSCNLEDILWNFQLSKAFSWFWR